MPKTTQRGSTVSGSPWMPSAQLLPTPTAELSLAPRLPGGTGDTSNRPCPGPLPSPPDQSHSWLEAWGVRADIVEGQGCMELGQFQTPENIIPGLLSSPLWFQVGILLLTPPSQAALPMVLSKHTLNKQPHHYHFRTYCRPLCISGFTALQECPQAHLAAEETKAQRGLTCPARGQQMWSHTGLSGPRTGWVGQTGRPRVTPCLSPTCWARRLTSVSLSFLSC